MSINYSTPEKFIFLLFLALYDIDIYEKYNIFTELQKYTPFSDNEVKKKKECAAV